jgi:hypothetical protein
MRILSYQEAADRIAWERGLRISELRDDLLSAVASRLQNFSPNTCSNIKHPWKLNDRFSIRAWCPLHTGQWARLIVRAAEDGPLNFECFRGCSQEAIEQTIHLQSVTLIGKIADAIAQTRSTSHASGRVTQSGNSRSSIHSSADGPRLHLVSSSSEDVIG